MKTDKAATRPAKDTPDPLTIRPVAVIRTEFPSKFGIPRQAGLVKSLAAEIVFEQEFRNPDALRKIDSFSHLWLIWGFSASRRSSWSPTVRPPRLGGNERVGVFASRSPFRPNSLGLSVVELERVDWDDARGPVLHVRGADLMDGTPIYDIKPYIAYSDCIEGAQCGYASVAPEGRVQVDFPQELLQKVPEDRREALIGVLAQDPRPAYQNDPQRVYGFPFAGWEVRFTVDKDVLTVKDILTEKEVLKKKY